MGIKFGTNQYRIGQLMKKSEDFSLESQTQPNKPYFDRKDSKVEEVMLYPERSKNPKWQHLV